MPFTNQWDTTQPPDTQLANLLGQDIRNLKLDIQQRLVLSGLSGSKPPLNTDAQPANWTGMLYFATDTGHIFQWNGASWVDITNSFLLPEVVTYFNANCATGITVPGGSLVAGNIVDVVAQVVQPPGGGACQLNSPLISGLPSAIPSNVGSSTVVWTVFSRIFVSAVGINGGTGGYYMSAQSNVNTPITPASFQASQSGINTTINIPVSMQLGSGCTAGPITVKVM